jgi:uncharacterized protein (TIGR03086 family)
MDPPADLAVLDLMVPLVAGFSDAELRVATPCEGWTVRDLLDHMNDEHEAIVVGLIGPAERERDPRVAFGLAAGRWGRAFAEIGSDEAVLVPKFGTSFPVDAVLGVHLADMVAHTWDLTVATHRPFPIPEPIIIEAAGMADLIPDSGELRGPNGYGPVLPVPQDATPLDRLLGRLGRDPAWQPPP